MYTLYDKWKVVSTREGNIFLQYIHFCNIYIEKLKKLSGLEKLYFLKNYMGVAVIYLQAFFWYIIA